ncbi:MAG: serine/threonine-protein phosphatase [Acidobacteriota bacterium]|nr:serine/threonine-protein phosphatase [Acidobacteriota bacterium]
MAAKPAGSGPGKNPSDDLVRELMTELGRAFDLSTALGDRTLGAAVEDRIRSLELGEKPEWGTDGALTQLAKQESGALDFYYRPHLFPDMDPALRLGHRLQFDLLPRHLPEESPLRIAAVLESYCHLSGDLLGWRLESDELFLWIVDVSGHGVRAGLAAATLYFLINSIEKGLSPARFSKRINEGVLAARNPEDPGALFATGIWLRAEAGGRVTYASAGHHPIVLLRSGGEVEYLGSTGIPLGLIARRTFEERQFELVEGDALCLFTDGLVEARSPDEEEFGTDRLVDVRRGWSGSPMELTRAIYLAVREHQATSLLDDDLTFMVVERSEGA